MLLSYKKPVTADCAEENHGAELIADENARTWWRASDKKAGHLVTLDLEKECILEAVQVNFADDGIEVPVPPQEELHGEATQRRKISASAYPTGWLLEGSLDAESWTVLADKRKLDADSCHDLVITGGIPARYVRLTVTEMPFGQPAAVSGVRVFGTARGAKPGTPQFTAESISDLDVRVGMAAENAIGYQILWGYSPEKLYHSYLTYYTEQKIGGLTAGQEVWLRVDAFN